MRSVLVTVLIAALSFDELKRCGAWQKLSNLNWVLITPVIVSKLVNPNYKGPLHQTREEILNEKKAWIELGEFSVDHRLKCGPGRVGDLSKMVRDEELFAARTTTYNLTRLIAHEQLTRRGVFCAALELGSIKAVLYWKLAQLEYWIDHCFVYPDSKKSTKSRKLKVIRDISESLAKIPIKLEVSLNVMKDNKGRETSLIVENVTAQMGEIEFKKDLKSDINKTMKLLVSYFNSTVLKDIANRTKYFTEKAFSKILSECYIRVLNRQ